MPNKSAVGRKIYHRPDAFALYGQLELPGLAQVDMDEVLRELGSECGDTDMPVSAQSRINEALHQIGADSAGSSAWVVVEAKDRPRKVARLDDCQARDEDSEEDREVHSEDESKPSSEPKKIVRYKPMKELSPEEGAEHKAALDRNMEDFCAGRLKANLNDALYGTRQNRIKALTWFYGPEYLGKRYKFVEETGSYQEVDVRADQVGETVHAVCKYLGFPVEHVREEFGLDKIAAKLGLDLELETRKLQQWAILVRAIEDMTSEDAEIRKHVTKWVTSPAQLGSKPRWVNGGWMYEPILARDIPGTYYYCCAVLGLNPWLARQRMYYVGIGLKHHNEKFYFVNDEGKDKPFVNLEDDEGESDADVSEDEDEPLEDADESQDDFVLE